MICHVFQEKANFDSNFTLGIFSNDHRLFRDLMKMEKFSMLIYLYFTVARYCLLLTIKKCFLLYIFPWRHQLVFLLQPLFCRLVVVVGDLDENTPQMFMLALLTLILSLTFADKIVLRTVFFRLSTTSRDLKNIQFKNQKIKLPLRYIKITLLIDKGRRTRLIKLQYKSCTNSSSLTFWSIYLRISIFFKFLHL